MFALKIETNNNEKFGKMQKRTRRYIDALTIGRTFKTMKDHRRGKNL